MVVPLGFQSSRMFSLSPAYWLAFLTDTMYVIGRLTETEENAGQSPLLPKTEGSATSFAPSPAHRVTPAGGER